MNLARFFSSAAALVAVPALSLLACGGDDDGAEPSPVADAGPRLDGPQQLNASCPVFVDSPALMPTRVHKPEGTEIQWDSNPPSSGDHYPVWATYKEYNSVVHRGYLVHALEHGAVLLLYKCDQPPCTSVVEGLRRVRDALPSDPLCDPSIRVRVIIAQDPLLDVPVAAAAWGWTYKGQCVDEPTLTQFAKDHYAQGPENTCGPGRSFD